MNNQNMEGKTNPMTEIDGDAGSGHFQHQQPTLGKRAHELQSFGEVMKRLRIGLSDDVRSRSITELNQVLADSIMLKELYKKHHWQVSGITFRELHLLFDKHYEEQVDLVDEIAERIQILGGVSVAVPQDVAEMTRISRPLKGREEVPV